MSDAYQAPAPAPAPAPAQLPAQVSNSSSEVPINPSPASAPAPITNTPPPAVPSSRHEVIERAFERAKVERKGPAEARMGHNQPPEATEKEKPVPPREAPLNLKKRPADQEPRERGEHGHFAPKEGREGGSPRVTPGVTPSHPAGRPAPSAAPHSHPLPRMSAVAKAEWE